MVTSAAEDLRDVILERLSGVHRFDFQGDEEGLRDAD